VPRDYRRAGELPPGDPVLLDQLVDRLLDYKATVVDTSPDRLPADLAAALRETMPEDGRLIVPPGLPPAWSVPGAVVDDGSFDAAALDGFAGVLTACAAAVAETGTIALDGGPDQGRRAITLVPDRHFCVVRAGQVVQTVPDLLARLTPTRPLTLVSGPSATSDIELNRVEGVHGPRTLVVILVRAG
jgi:L-lactate dehydrogenase complex protein LldG